MIYRGAFWLQCRGNQIMARQCTAYRRAGTLCQPRSPNDPQRYGWKPTACLTGISLITGGTAVPTFAGRRTARHRMKNFSVTSRALARPHWVAGEEGLVPLPAPQWLRTNKTNTLRVVVYEEDNGGESQQWVDDAQFELPSCEPTTVCTRAGH